MFSHWTLVLIIPNVRTRLKGLSSKTQSVYTLKRIQRSLDRFPVVRHLVSKCICWWFETTIAQTMALGNTIYDSKNYPALVEGDKPTYPATTITGLK